MKKAIYPGTFDPLTYGHIDILQRSLKIFDKITILLAKNTQKKTFFNLEERRSQIEDVLKEYQLDDRVDIDSFNGLLVDYCQQKEVQVIIRGLRPLVDFEYEFEMAMTNRGLNENVETVFIITDQKYFYLRSTLIKDILRLGGNVIDSVPQRICEDLIKKIQVNNE
ncbi:MAG: pantetheine-phosphate adenylyltransferase [Spirochaetes bacterium]|nr:pantetheine-phosphate adenylyltransferase [Spirochaetota bacterium]